MRKAFTLIELLTVVALMALLGGTAVGGYRAMQRGMEEKGVMQNVNSAVRAAFQRAQIDRQPTIIYFWNETLTGETEDDNAVVVGKAVAVRRNGRISDVQGSYLIDEFGDLERSYAVVSDEESGSGSSNQHDSMFIYPMGKLSDMSKINRTRVRSAVVKKSESPIFLTGRKQIGDNEIPAYAFEQLESDVTWQPGMAYGFEFLSLQLPHGYIFGSEYSSDVGNPVKPVTVLSFKPGTTSSNGSTSGGYIGNKSQIEIFHLRPNGATLTPVSIGKSDPPDRTL